MKRLIPSFIIVLCLFVLLPAFTEGQGPEADARYRARLEKSVTLRAEAERLAREKGFPIRTDHPKGGISELQRLIFGMPQYYTTGNVDAAVSTRTDITNDDIGGGTGFTVGMWDGGHVRKTHQEFGTRVSWPAEEMPIEHNHATHVGGTMIAAGVDPDAKGMAYGAALHSFDWTNDLAEMTLRALMGLNLSNHSYSFTRGWDYDWDGGYWVWYGWVPISTTEDAWFGYYDDTSVDIDQFAVDNPHYLAVFSGGNHRGEGPAPGTGHYYWDPVAGDWAWSTDVRDLDGDPDGYDCLSNGYQVAKNVLTVGAVDDVPVYAGPGDVVMSTFSAWGPTDDGRIKPDIVGNGVGLFSPVAYNSVPALSDTSYGTYSGTSMSAPNVTGSIALLRSYYNMQHGSWMRSATLKALVIHTAREAGPAPGPDYMFGWGLLDTYAAYQHISDDINEGGTLIEELTLDDGETLEFDLYCDGSRDIKVTICWTDPAGTPVALTGLDPPDRMLVNDLDMNIQEFGGFNNIPWILFPGAPATPAGHSDNNRDNVEQVLIASPNAGFYTIYVDHKASLDGGSQDFSMIISGAQRKNVWHVYDDGSGDAPTIAAAVDSAVHGDYIIAHAGTFYEHDIEVTEELTIIGFEGSGSVIVDAQSLGRCFNFSHSFYPVTFEGFTLRNGLVSGTGDAGAGGGLFCRTNIDIRDCIVTDCGASEGGGGIHCDTGSYVSIEDCVISGNTAGLYGGGVLVDDAGMVSLDGCTLSDNEATTYDGGGLCAWDVYVTVDDCTIDGNTAGRDGGGIYSGFGSTVEMTGSTIGGNTAGDQGGGVWYYALMTFDNCTIVDNYAATEGAGMYIVNGGTGSTEHTIVAFNLNGFGIFTMSSSMTISCSDVYGNEDGNYGGNLPDQTGSNNNISLDPLFCDYGSEDYTIADTSPCAPAYSPCGQLIGRFGVNCSVAPDLVITNVSIPEDHPVVGTSITMTVKVKNLGSSEAENFYIDYYEDRATAPVVGVTGEQRQFVASLAAGDSIEWTTGPIAASCFGPWESWFQVDSEDDVGELDENNNTSGPHDIFWTIPSKAGWAVPGGDDFHSSPAIALLDDDPVTQEVIVGCDDGYLYAWEADGDPVPGWPVDVGDSLVSSPAVGDVTGDYHLEVVVGCVDGYLYVYDYQGAELWSHDAGAPIYTTPALADLDDDGKLEIIYAVSAGKNTHVTVLEGDAGATYPGSWPVALAGPGATSPAVGDVDSDGHYEISVVSYGLISPDIHSLVHLLTESGSSYSMNWPVTIDTEVVAPPVIGELAGMPGGPLEFAIGGMNGVVYVINTVGIVWLSPPHVTGAIETSPALVQYDKDMYLEILVSSRYWHETFPPFGRWEGYVTLIDDDKTIITGWPNAIGTWLSPNSAPSPIVFGDRVIEGSPSGNVFGWVLADAENADGFPHYVAGFPYSSAAAGDLDGDGYLEIVVGTSMNAVYCLDMSCSDAYLASVQQDWMMFRHDRTRTGCYIFEPATGVEDEFELAPKATALRSIFPNPFNPVTRISFDITRKSRVNITVYDISGRRVCELKNGVMNPGSHELVWQGVTDSGRAATSGVYFCRLIAGDIVQTRKLILLR